METFIFKGETTMTPLIFQAAMCMLMGYLVGKLFIKLNPVLVLIGLIVCYAIWITLQELDDQYLIVFYLLFGAILNFSQPITRTRLFLADIFGVFNLRGLRARYSSDIEMQKQQAEQELYTQKRKVEDELKRQKYEAEMDIQRQRREAEEAIKRQAENLKREQQRYSNRQRQTNNSNQNSDTSDFMHLNPLVFADACEILGLGQGCSLKQYKERYLKLMKMYHADKLSGLSEELRKQEEEKAKTLNMAMNTIKKKLR